MLFSKRINRLISLLLLLATCIACAACSKKENALKAKYKDIKVGDRIEFGSYEQEVAEEPIVWIVLEVNDGKALVISDKIIECRKIADEKGPVTWETCSLREWLNNDFINTAFTEDEIDIIAEVELVNDDNSVFGTDCGNNTTDKVFLLSSDECKLYFPDKDSRKCEATTHAADNSCWGSTTGVTEGYSHWWLRTSGKTNCHQTIVYAGGDILDNGLTIYDPDTGVRPVLWIEIE